MAEVRGLNICVSSKGHGDMCLTNQKNLEFGINDSYVNHFLRRVKSYPGFYWSTIKNRLRFLRSSNIRTERIFCPTLGSSDEIAVINEINARYFEGNGLFWRSAFLCDAVITNLTDFPIAFFPADCPIVVLFDQKRHILAQIHSGRENILKNIVGKVAKIMKEDFFCNPDDICVWFSPHLCSKCYVLTYLGFIDNPGYKKISPAIVEIEGGWSFDMRLAIEIQLVLEGIGNIISGPTVCTICGDEHYFSHRGWTSRHPNHLKPGRFAVISMMTKI